LKNNVSVVSKDRPKRQCAARQCAQESCNEALKITTDFTAEVLGCGVIIPCTTSKFQICSSLTFALIS